MADYFGQSPNFVNPAYATPEQLATQRAYAAELMKRSGEGASRPTGVIGNALSSVAAMLERRRADEIQSQAASENAGHMTALIQQLQRGQSPDAANVARMTANPMISPEQRDLLIRGLIQPKAVEDVAGRPGYMSPVQGVKGAPVDQRFQPGFRTQESAGSVSTTSPVPAPPLGSTMQPAPPPIPGMQRLDPAATERWRQDNPLPAAVPGGGGQAPAAALPTAPAPAISPRLDALADADRRLTAEKERSQGGARAEGEVILKDVTRAAAAPETLKGLGLMRDTISTVGDRMTFGPTARLSNEARRVIANYVPGLSDQQALAGADAIEKLNLGLAGNLSQQLGLNPSDIYRSVASVPGNEKSKEGTLALINMMEQAARNDQYVGTTLYQQNRGNLAAYQQARQAYYDSHPIINPITGRPVAVDAKNAPAAAGPVTVRTPEEARRLPSGTQIRLPDGSIGRVP